MKSLDVVTFGEVLGSFIALEAGPLDADRNFEVRLAGSELNTAIGVARLGHRVGFVGSVGDDFLGRMACARLLTEGVDTRLTTVDEVHTGLQIKQRSTSGDPQYLYYRSQAAGSRLTWTAETHDVVGAGRHLHLTGIPLAISGSCRDFALHAVGRARALGMTISFDPNLRPALWGTRKEMVEVVNRFAALADWILPGSHEAEVLTGHRDPERVAAHYLERGARGVSVKLGADGAALFTADGCWTRPAFSVRVVDTLGAGDGFTAGLISGLLDELDPAQTLERACAVGALATTNDGDCDGMPTRGQLDELLATPVGR